MMGTSNAAGAMKIPTASTDRASVNATMTATIVAAKPIKTEIRALFTAFSFSQLGSSSVDLLPRQDFDNNARFVLLKG